MTVPPQHGSFVQVCDCVYLMLQEPLQDRWSQSIEPQRLQEPVLLPQVPLKLTVVPTEELVSLGCLVQE